LSLFPLLPAKPLRSKSKVLRRSGPARKEGKESLTAFLLAMFYGHMIATAFNVL
jgi:hypothetical protein